jgi:hypothetical protein
MPLLIALVLGCWRELPLLLGRPLAVAAEVTVADLLKAPERYARQEVTLQGTAHAVKPTVSRRGNPSTTVELTDASGQAVTVFTWGHPALKSGDRVAVTGLFQGGKRVGRYTFYNQIDANNIKVVGR